MLRMPYADVLKKVEGLWLATRADMPALNASLAQTHLNTWAAQFWRKYFWPEWRRVEKRRFRNAWSSATSYAASSATAAVEVFHVRSGKYAQSLHATNLNNEPFDSSGNENSAHWAQCAAEYSGDDYAAGTAYAVGDVVRNPDDDRFYQCITAHTGGATLDATKFGILTPFKRSLDYEQSWETNAIGRVKRIWDRDPDVRFGAACRIGHLPGQSIFVAGTQAVVWVEFQLRAPRWLGEPYSASTTYSLGQRAQDSTEGGEADFFTSLANANTGNALTNTAFWERIDFPEALADGAARAAYAELLRSDGEMEERAALQQAKAEQLVEMEFNRTVSGMTLPVPIAV